MMMVGAELLLLSLAGAGIGYLALAISCVWRFRPGGDSDPNYRPGVTILKPLCGADPDLYACLQSFCRQDYPELQIIFGVAGSSDPALPIVRRIMAEFAERDIALIIDRAQHGANRKVSNLINMMTVAKYGILIVCDSDVRISDNCLGALVRPLADPIVGAVTAPIRGVPGRGFAAMLSCAFINDWYFPQTLIAETLGPVRSCLGPLTVVRRNSLDAIGGFAALADQIADDFMLGQLIARRGERVVISRTMIDVMVHEDFASLVRHELRWARTIRATEPTGHLWSAVTHVLPIIVPLLFGCPSRVALPLALLAVTLRILLNRLVCVRLGVTRRPPLWLIFLREGACIAIWLSSYASRRIEWRGANFVIARGGSMRPKAARSPPRGSDRGGRSMRPGFREAPAREA
jgi:ceramide glucosyltransferase